MKGYWLVLGAEVTRRRRRRPTARSGRRSPSATARGLVRDTEAVDAREARDATRVLLVEFPTFEAAKACYDDPAYREAREVALRAARRSLVLLRGEIA